MLTKKLAASAALAAALTIGATPVSAAEGPYTQAQLDKGKSEYNTHCRTCHAKDGKGALGPALFGDPYKKRFGGGTAADVRTYVYEYMPQTAPKSLKDEQLDPLTAYILSLNGFTPGQTEMSAESAKTAKIEK